MVPLPDIQIRPYRHEDEVQWLRCRALAFLDTAYYDNVLREKERYRHPAIELVAVRDGSILGLIDVECERAANTVCSVRPGLGAMIWNLAVHPDYRRKGVGTALLCQAKRLAAQRGAVRMEAWTRDNSWVQHWYESRGFQEVDSYPHVFIEGRDELRGAIHSEIPGLKPVQAFAHYQGDDRDPVRRRFRRVHRCVLYELKLSEFGRSSSRGEIESTARETRLTAGAIFCEGGRGDIPECLGIARGLPGYFTTSAVENMAHDLEAHEFFVVRHGPGITGFVCVAQKNSHVFEILWIAVRGCLTGCGVGTIMIDNLCHGLRQKGARLVVIKTLAPSVDYLPYARTRRFYEKNGFALCDEVDPYPGWDPGNPCAIYVKAL